MFASKLLFDVVVLLSYTSFAHGRPQNLNSQSSLRDTTETLPSTTSFRPIISASQSFTLVASSKHDNTITPLPEASTTSVAVEKTSSSDIVWSIWKNHSNSSSIDSSKASVSSNQSASPYSSISGTNAPTLSSISAEMVSTPESATTVTDIDDTSVKGTQSATLVLTTTYLPIPTETVLISTISTSCTKKANYKTATQDGTTTGEVNLSSLVAASSDIAASDTPEIVSNNTSPATRSGLSTNVTKNSWHNPASTSCTTQSDINSARTTLTLSFDVTTLTISIPTDVTSIPDPKPTNGSSGTFTTTDEVSTTSPSATLITITRSLSFPSSPPTTITATVVSTSCITDSIYYSYNSESHTYISLATGSLASICVIRACHDSVCFFSQTVGPTGQSLTVFPTTASDNTPTSTEEITTTVKATTTIEVTVTVHRSSNDTSNTSSIATQTIPSTSISASSSSLISLASTSETSPVSNSTAVTTSTSSSTNADGLSTSADLTGLSGATITFGTATLTTLSTSYTRVGWETWRDAHGRFGHRHAGSNRDHRIEAHKLRTTAAATASVTSGTGKRMWFDGIAHVWRRLA